MDRNDLKGHKGDRLNALLAEIEVNFRKLLAASWRAHGELRLNCLQWVGLSPGHQQTNRHDHPLTTAA